jgi:hypothetical protein
MAPVKSASSEVVMMETLDEVLENVQHQIGVVNFADNTHEPKPHP